MIPKILNYVWVGGSPIPKRESDCIDTWRRLCPDYELVLWNEDSFDVGGCLWVKQALDRKMYAFAADAIRWYALYKNGGIYLDTDVYLLKSPDGLLSDEAFASYEGGHGLWLGTAAFGASPNNDYIKFLYSYYCGRPLVQNGRMQNQANVMAVTELTKRYYGGFKPSGLKPGAGRVPRLLAAEGKPPLRLYPGDYFYPKDYMTGKLKLTGNTVAVHDFALNSSWWTPNLRRGAAFARGVRKVFGRWIFKVFERMVQSSQTKTVKRSIKRIPLPELEI